MKPLRQSPRSFHVGVPLAFPDIGFPVAYRYLLYGQLRERARWTKSSAVIGYPSGQDGAILPARDYPLYPAWKISPKAI